MSCFSNKSGRVEQSLTTSPGFHTLSGYNGGNAESKKMQDLLKSHDQIYQELRKATEKYLNQRVENTKLRDEIQMLQTQLDAAHSQVKKAQTGGGGSLPPQSPPMDSNSKQPG